MNLIIPMAGMGKRLRPHTLITPKPLFKIAGKPIVERLVKDIAKLLNIKFDKIGFVIGNFPDSIRKELIDLAHAIDAQPEIFIQDKPLGTADAVFRAADILNGEVIIAFADTLFEADFELDPHADAVIWTKKVDDPSKYGVVKTNEKGYITDFVEKPATFVSDQAIIGIYYFKRAEELLKKIEFIISNDIKVKGEYQLTDALKLMMDDGYLFVAQSVKEWYDCGNKDLVIKTTAAVLKKEGIFIGSNFTKQNSLLLGNYFIGDNVFLKNVIILDNVVIENNVRIENAILENVIIQENASVRSILLKNSIIGANTNVMGNINMLNLGAYSSIEL